MPSWPVHFEIKVNTENARIRDLVARVKAVSSTIEGIPIPPYVRTRLNTLNILRAVRGTTGIEGTELSESEVSNVLNASPGDQVLGESRAREEREVRNAQALMRYVQFLLTRDPGAQLDEALIRSFHRMLTDGIPYGRNAPGRFRQHRAAAGTYRAPPHDEVPRLMRGFIEWVNGPAGRAFDPIVRAILAHFLVVSIHPFGDGNGRTSRGVESFLLYKARANVLGFYSLANHYYKNRSEYIQLLDRCRFQSDPDVSPFVTFALEGMAAELDDVRKELMQAIRIISFRDLAREVFQSEGKLGKVTGNRQLHFLFDLGEQVVAIADIRSGLHPLAHLYKGVGRKTLSRDLNELERLDLIVNEHRKVRANTGIMDLFTGMPPLAESSRSISDADQPISEYPD